MGLFKKIKKGVKKVGGAVEHTAKSVAKGVVKNAVPIALGVATGGASTAILAGTRIKKSVKDIKSKAKQIEKDISQYPEKAIDDVKANVSKNLGRIEGAQTEKEFRLPSRSKFKLQDARKQAGLSTGSTGFLNTPSQISQQEIDEIETTEEEIYGNKKPKDFIEQIRDFLGLD